MTNSTLQTDDQIVAELGRRLAARRVDLDLTQAMLAEQAGVGKRTLERLESGGSVQLTTLVRVLRALDLLAVLDGVIPDDAPRPLDIVQRGGARRQRASGRSRRTSDWDWQDEP